MCCSFVDDEGRPAGRPFFKGFELCDRNGAILVAQMKTIKRLSLVTTMLLAFSVQAEPEFDRGERMDWWREARFGMFVHWGLYSGLAGTWKGEAAPRDKNLEHIQRVVDVDTYTYAAGYYFIDRL